jgi:CubicO group peptidase (beta-lactamase class C family)
MTRVKRVGPAFRPAIAALKGCATICAFFVLASAIQSQSATPAKEWEPIAPDAAGFAATRLAAVHAWLASLDTTAMMVIVGGRVVLSYGDTAHVSYLASGRKSVLALLYGRYVEKGTIPLDRTLSDLRMDDVGGLLPRERGATIEHLLTARSGIYHPAANGGDNLAHAPPRGSQAPGAHYLYNNWDFNAAGAVFETLAGRDIYDALDRDLAQPLGLQDFERAKQVKNGNLTVSQYPAYPIWLSTRDMARIGLLALRAGQWGDRELVPSDWIRRTTRLVSPFSAMDQTFEDSPPTVGRWGYGYLWWVWDALAPSDPMAGAFTAWGVGGQYITVIPKLDLVVAHKTDTANGKAVSARQFDAVLRMLIAAKM